MFIPVKTPVNYIVWRNLGAHRMTLETYGGFPRCSPRDLSSFHGLLCPCGPRYTPKSYFGRGAAFGIAIMSV